MKRRVLALSVCIAIVCSGCSYVAAPPRTTTILAPAAGESGTLPSSHGPLGRRHRAIQQVEEVFRNVASLRRADRFTVSELKAITRASRFLPIAVSGCDLEALKIFIASDWAPVVVTRSPVGPKHVRAVVGYDDSTEQLTLVDPINYAQARLEYSEFSKQWDDPQKTCLLVFSQYVGADRIRSVLKKYLPEEKVDSIQIRTPRKG